jgi:2,3,4,5-tetrahydropyridine-2-carboxylate N-succinyltransferase
MTPADLEREMTRLASADTFSDDDRALFEQFRDALRSGAVRAASPDGQGGWTVHAWVKRGILTGFRMGSLVDMGGSPQRFVDKDTYPVRPLDVSDRVRVVPGGSSIRDGSYVAPGVVVMPPAYVNVGAYVDEGTMVDSHALVGSCAQIGRRVHLSAAVQIGGVLEPVGAAPVVIEDDAMIGGGCGVYEGVRVRARAVLGPGVNLTSATPVFDLPNQRILRAGEGAPLTIPEGAVVVPGARAVTDSWGREQGLSLYAPVIVKYRDDKTDAAVKLEDVLR